jgi:large conductance mechanosensitive channel
VNDILMPPIGLLLGRVDFSSLFVNLTPDKYTGASVSEARKAGAAVIAYGTFINNVINFLIVAAVIFLVVKQANRFKKPVVAEVTTKECPFCLKDIPLKATKCAFCTSAV